MPRPVIEIENLKKEYRLGSIGGKTFRKNVDELIRNRKGDDRKFMALDGVDLSVDQGEALGIVGSNGAGKSTLLKIISRITAPSEGEVRIHGRIASMLEVGTGFHGELTGRENIYMNGAILGMKRSEIDRKLDQIIDFSECEKFIDTPVKRYSSGMYVKLAFSVAAHLDAEIMIMDEVLAVGDMKFQKKCLEKMHGVAMEEGRTILYVSHNMKTISDLCNRCIVLDHGKKILDGPVKDAVSLYLDDMPEGITSAEYEDTIRYSWLSRDDVRLQYAELVDKKTEEYSSDEKLRLKIVWKNNKDIRDLCFRMEIHDEAGNGVGTTFIDNIYSGDGGETVEKTLELDLSEIAEGKYTTDYTFYNHGFFNDTIDLDCIHGLGFTIKNGDSVNMTWNKQAWGSIRLPDMKELQNE